MGSLSYRLISKHLLNHFQNLIAFCYANVEQCYQDFWKIDDNDYNANNLYIKIN